MAGDITQTVVTHPFTPASMDIPNYLPNSWSTLYLLVTYFGAVLFVFTVTFVLFRKDKYGTRLAVSERLLMCWFCISGFTHVILEASLILMWKSIVQRQDFFSNCWKEYGKADSRYMIQHVGTYTVEVITVLLVGPGCFLVLWKTFQRLPGRYAVEMLVSTFHLYGTLVYNLDAYFDDFRYIPVNDPLLFGVYFVGFNSPWVIIPIVVIIRDVIKFVTAQSLADNRSMESPNTKKKN